MIPPWSEAEKARVQQVIDMLSRCGETEPAFHYCQSQAAALRACLARAEQADEWQRKAEAAEAWAREQSTEEREQRQRAEQAEAGREAALGELLDEIAQYRPFASDQEGAAFDVCTRLLREKRQESGDRLSVSDAFTEAIKDRTYFEQQLAHAEAERDEARKNAEYYGRRFVEAERRLHQVLNDSHVIPVADRERALELARESGWQVSQGDRTVSVEQHAEARRLLKLASPGTRTEEP